MKKLKLIGKQQKEIEELKYILEEQKRIAIILQSRFISIGGPLNENHLKMDSKQIGFCFELNELVNNLFGV